MISNWHNKRVLFYCFITIGLLMLPSGVSGAAKSFLQLTDFSNNDCGATWTPDSRRIAFLYWKDNTTSRWITTSIWIVDADGTNHTPLTSNESNDWTPSVSPDGKWVAYASDRGTNYTGHADLFTNLDIWIVSINGSEHRQITSGPRSDGQPAWSPDGEKIAFTSNRSGEIDIWVMDADGSNLTRLTRSDVRAAVDPAWSPDGKRIAYTDFPGYVRIMDADGSNDTELLGRLFIWYEDPTWSPDGNRIAVRRNSLFSKDRDIWIFDLKTGRSSRVSPPGMGNDECPAWSPDGSRIAFGSEMWGGGLNVTVAVLDELGPQDARSPGWSVLSALMGLVLVYYIVRYNLTMFPKS